MESHRMTQGQTGMTAVIIRDDNLGTVLSRLRESNIDVAAINSPLQITISGLKSTIEAIGKDLVQTGCAKACIPLKQVSEPFHSRYMANAGHYFSLHLSNFQLNPFDNVVLSNVTGKPFVIDNVNSLLTRQLSSPVQWLDSIRYCQQFDNVDFVEVGPRSVLSSLLKKDYQIANSSCLDNY